MKYNRENDNLSPSVGAGFQPARTIHHNSNLPILKIDYTLYLVTDRDLMSSPTVEESVEQAIKGGVTLVQLREKKVSGREFYETAVRVGRITKSYNIPFIINDRVDIALSVGATGVHIGQSDMPADVVRKLIGSEMILGVSVSTVAEAVQAENNGADYLGVGAMFSTDTKTNARLVSMECLRAIRKAVSIPIVVIGGINKQTIPLFAGTGINGVSVVSAIISEKDVCEAARELRELGVRSCS